MSQETSESDARRARSIAYLKRKNVPFIDHLPNIAKENETTRRTKVEVGNRILCLVLASMKGADAEHSFVLNGLRHFGVTDSCSPKEERFFRDPSPSEETKLQFLWGLEAAIVLMWAGNAVGAMTYPSEPSDWNAIWKKFHSENRESFFGALTLRPQSAILDQADLTYRLHWAVREARLKGRSPPARLNFDVVMERHIALNWLAAPLAKPYLWDEVPIDT